MRRVVLAVLAVSALAQEKAPTFDAILVKPEELPKNVHAAAGIHSVSPQARTYFETPAMKDIMKALAPEVAGRVREETLDSFPVPKRKECQSFQADGHTAGSVFVYEYEEGDAAELLPFLESYIWGSARSEKHPEEIIVQGRFIWVLSFPFPAGDPAAEWYKDRLRKKFRIPAFRERPDLASLKQKIVKACDAKDAAGGIRLLQENAKAAADWSFGQNMLGQFAEMKKDHVLAEKAYRKALSLHDTVADPLDPNLVWVTIDGLASALHAQGKWADAGKLFQRAITAAGQCGDGAKKAKAQSQYNLACAYSMMKKFPEALRSLEDAIVLDVAYIEEAKKDADFAELRKQKEFSDLLERAKPPAAPPGAPFGLDAVLVEPGELPKDVVIIEGIHTNTPHPAAFYETPSIEGFSKILPEQLRKMIPKEQTKDFPLPKGKHCQSFLAKGGAKGTVFVFEYETADLSRVLSFIDPILYGAEGPSDEHPEEIIHHDRFLWILSFPRQDRAVEWYKERLRKKLHVPAPRAHPELNALGMRIAQIMEAEDFAAGRKLLQENAKAIEGWAFGQCMVGKFAELAGGPRRRGGRVSEGAGAAREPRGSLGSAVGVGGARRVRLGAPRPRQVQGRGDGTREGGGRRAQRGRRVRVGPFRLRTCRGPRAERGVRASAAHAEGGDRHERRAEGNGAA